jgi:hypothetical protein
LTEKGQKAAHLRKSTTDKNKELITQGKGCSHFSQFLGLYQTMGAGSNFVNSILQG